MDIDVDPRVVADREVEGAAGRYPPSPPAVLAMPRLLLAAALAYLL